MAKALLAVVVVAVAAVLELGLVGANFQDQCDITWEPQNAKMTEGGDHLTLSLVSNSSGCMLRTKKQFIYGSVSTRIQLVKGNSAGTVTTYYTSSIGDKHDEIDFEFLGNSSGLPYTFHTNVFADGVGSREMQFRPWWFVDSIPIRVFRNHEKEGVPFPTKRPMYAFSSIWAAEDWATQGGRVKTDWTKAPFVAEYRDIGLNICECPGSGSGSSSSFSSSSSSTSGDAEDPACAQRCATSDHWYAAEGLCQLSDKQLRQMKAVQLGYTIYDYCADAQAKGRPVPPECSMPQY
uniref:Xyloglucan endotransglucosylase/hydrolase n=1 Tax=Oryza rufipogon TaxID=4529 RepID=A0A0E0PXC8_ORYRU